MPPSLDALINIASTNQPARAQRNSVLLHCSFKMVQPGQITLYGNKVTLPSHQARIVIMLNCRIHAALPLYAPRNNRTRGGKSKAHLFLHRYVEQARVVHWGGEPCR